MRMVCGLVMLIGGSLLAASFATAQRPGGGSEPAATKSADADDLVSRMMAFDKDKDGKLTRAEVTDARLTRLFDRADADKDGSVTKEELTALAVKDQANDRGFGGPGGPGGFGGPGGGPGGPGGPRMGGFRPGDVLPTMLQDRLGLSSEQKTQVEALQKEVDARLARILTDEQKEQFKQMRERGPGGPGGPGGFGGPGGPGGRGRPGGGPGGDGPGGPPRDQD